MHLSSTTILGSILSLRQSTPSYELYSACAEICFESALKVANCAFTTEVAWIACLCHDGSAQADFAQCTYTDCGGQVLNESAAIHMHNCQVNGSPSALSEEQFIADGEAAGAEAVSSSSSIAVGLATSVVSTASASTSTSGISGVQQISSSTAQDTALLTTIPLASSSPTATFAVLNTNPTQTKAGSSNPTSTSGGSNTGSGGSGSGTLSTAALIGTIIASLTGAVGSCIGVWFGWKTYKQNKKNKEESSGGNGAANAT